MKPQKITIGDQAIPDLVQFCRDHGHTRLLVVADDNTYAAQGAVVEAALIEAGYDVDLALLTGDEVVADAHYIQQVMLAADRRPRTYVPVGSGTITDICRFVSHRTRDEFISVPTAPSVDGFLSLGAPLIVGGVKRTISCHGPVAIFADVNTLAAAPRAMIAAGYGDVIGKYTSVADWRLGHLLWDEPFLESAALGTLDAVQLCVDNTEAISQASPDGLRALMQALLATGDNMLDFGGSQPASGSEHHYSHFWEMKLLREGRPALLHGAKVGVAATKVAEIYAAVRAMSLDEVTDRLEAAELPDPDVEIAGIRAAYLDQADGVIDGHQPFLAMDEVEFDAVKQRIRDNWDEVQAIADQVPPPEVIADLLKRVGGPSTVTELGLTDEELRLAERNGHYLRNRFTVRKLARLLDIG